MDNNRVGYAPLSFLLALKKVTELPFLHINIVSHLLLLLALMRDSEVVSQDTDG